MIEESLIQGGVMKRVVSVILSHSLPRSLPIFRLSESTLGWLYKKSPPGSGEASILGHTSCVESASRSPRVGTPQASPDWVEADNDS